MTALKKSTQVCEKFYPSRCGSCPIRPQCIGSSPYIVTLDSMKAWHDRCEKAAGDYMVQIAEIEAESGITHETN